MKRSVPLRRTPFQSRRREKKRALPRPGVTPPMPKGWKAIARSILERDIYRCRRCMSPRARHESGAIDHLLPRRIAPWAIKDPNNLAYLCHRCHRYKTHEIEPRLYRGDVLAFEVFLATLKLTGPIPGPTLLAKAYARLRTLQA